MQSFLWEDGAFEAKEALHRGDEQPVGSYLSDASKVLRLLADLADPDNEENKRLRLDPPIEHPPSAMESQDEEWEGTFYEVKEAIDQGNVVAVGWYLRDLSELLAQLTIALTNPKGHLGWQLKLKRKGRGRPRDPAKDWIDENIFIKVKFAAARGIKQESTIQDLMTKRRISRATIMRALRRMRRRSLSHKKGN